MSNSNNKPVAKPIFKKQLPQGISAAVFQNTRDGKTYRSINLQRSYKADGKWQRMSLYLDHEHIPFFMDALDATWRFLNDYPIGSVATVDAEPENVEPIVESIPAEELAA